MELENYVCYRCGRIHEDCICLEIQEDFYYYMDYLESKHNESLKEEITYPKFNGNDVEVSDGVIVSKDIYEKYYK